MSYVEWVIWGVFVIPIVALMLASRSTAVKDWFRGIY